MGIRAAETGDLAEIARIYAWYVEHSSATFALVAPTAREWATSFKLAGERNFPWLVSVEHDNVIGYATAGSFFPRRAYDSTVVSSIYLDHEQLGRGLGRPLYGAAVAALRSSPYHLAVAGITLPNDASVALHEALGFSPVGTFREVGFKLDKWRDVGWWQLPLD